MNQFRLPFRNQRLFGERHPQHYWVACSEGNSGALESLRYPTRRTWLVDRIPYASLEVKWQANSADAAFVAGLFAGVSLPVGDQQLTSDDYDPEFAIFWTYSGRLDWFCTAKLSGSGNKYKPKNAVGVNLSLTENTGAYFEYKGTFPEGQDLNFGITRLLDNNLQVDLNGSVGLNKRASDFAVGTGIAYRF